MQYFQGQLFSETPCRIKETYQPTYITLRKKLTKQVDETSNILEVTDIGVKMMEEKNMNKNAVGQWTFKTG